MDRIEDRRVDGVGDQPGQDAGDEPEGEGGKLDFLGYMFRYERDRKGRQHRYLNVTISEKALKRERQKLREKMGRAVCFKPLPQLINGAQRSS